MQSFADKCAAIESLLGFIFFHLDFIPGAMRIQQYGDSDGGAGRPPLQPVNVDCNGRCFTCLAYYTRLGKAPACPPEERWAREVQQLRRRYRIRDVEDSVLRLSEVDPVQAQAVWAEHVEPWPDPKTEPISPSVKAERVGFAELGVEWMAHDIRGDVLGYGEKPDPLENQIRQMHSQGYTNKRISKELRCRPKKVQDVLCEDMVRCE